MEIGKLYPYKDSTGLTVPCPVRSLVVSHVSIPTGDVYSEGTAYVHDSKAETCEQFWVIHNRKTGRKFVVSEQELIMLAIEKGINEPFEDTTPTKSKRTTKPRSVKVPKSEPVAVTATSTTEGSNQTVPGVASVGVGS